LVDNALAPGNKPARRDLHGRKISQKPVDNRQMKKERVEATRTRRAADNGFDLAKVDTQLQEFVKRDGDMEVSRNTEVVCWTGVTSIHCSSLLNMKCMGGI